MKIILLQDIPNIGQRYDVKEVSGGYAQNFLIPKKLAEAATKEALAKVEKLKTAAEQERKKQEELLMKNMDKMKGITVTMREKAAETGGLFSSVGKDKIVSELKKQHGIEIGEDNIDLEKPIKEVGEYEIPVIVEDKKTKFTLVIEAKE